MKTALMDSESLADWLHYLESLHPVTIDLGLQRVQEVGERLAVLQPASQVVLVAGTNGKGTTCAALEAIALAAGKTTAVYSSPHLLHYNERLRINGQALSDHQHCRAFRQVEQARQGQSLTYFEFGTLAALWLIQQQQPDVAIIEVGLGGRLDATNIVAADVSVIVTVDIDHQAYLGNTREQIGYEKAGIMRAGKPAVLGENMPDSVLSHAKHLGAEPVICGQQFVMAEQADRWTLSCGTQCWQSLAKPHIPVHNAALAVVTVEALGWAVDTTTLNRVFGALQVMGRWQQLQTSPCVMLDVAHNPEAARLLAHNIAQHEGSGKVYAVAAMLTDKDITSVVAILAPHIDYWYSAPLDVPRGDDGSALNAALLDYDHQCCPSVTQALRQALAGAGAEDLVVVFGSFFTVAEILTGDWAR